MIRASQAIEKLLLDWIPVGTTEVSEQFQAGEAGPTSVDHFGAGGAIERKLLILDC